MPRWMPWLVLAIWAVLDLMLLWQWRHPAWRIWPPPRARSWAFGAIWSLTMFGTMGYLWLAWYDAGSLPLPGFVRLVGLGLALIGLGLLLWSVFTLSLPTTSGLDGPLITHGPYRYSRNPQYVGDILLAWGLALFAASAWALIVALFISLWFALAPFVEEPHLRARFGQAYEAYARQVPRFWGRSRGVSSSSEGPN